MCQADADLIREWRDGITRRVIVINNTYQLAPWADVLYACDLRWWNKYYKEAKKKCAGQFWTYNQDAAVNYKINRWTPKPTGGNSGYQALRLAVDHFKANRVILVGFDMQGGHWHPQHGDHWPNPKEENLRQWRAWLAKYQPENVEIINATRETALTCYPQKQLEKVLTA